MCIARLFPALSLLTASFVVVRSLECAVEYVRIMDSSASNESLDNSDEERMSIESARRESADQSVGGECASSVPAVGLPTLDAEEKKADGETASGPGDGGAGPGKQGAAM